MNDMVSLEFQSVDPLITGTTTLTVILKDWQILLRINKIKKQIVATVISYNCVVSS